MKTKTAAAARACIVLALVAGLAGCPHAEQRSIDTATAAERLLGSWRADRKSLYQSPLREARIDQIDALGNAQGVFCATMREGFVRGGLLDGRTRWTVNGHLEARFGKSRIVFFPRGGTMRLIHEVHLRRSTRNDKFRATLHKGRTPHCVQWFRNRPVTPAQVHIGRTDDDPALTGTWTGRWSNGNLFEVAIEPPEGRDTPHGRACLMMVHQGEIKIWDLHPDAPRITARWRDNGRQVTVEQKANTYRTYRDRITLLGPDRAGLETTYDVGGQKERTSILTLLRGAAPDGCLVRTSSRPEGRGPYG